MSRDIFISYAREDQRRVETLNEFLKAQGWLMWWNRNISIGRRFSSEIENALKSARCMRAFAQKYPALGWHDNQSVHSLRL